MSQPTEPGAIINEKTALGAGLAATVVALLLVVFAIQQVLDIVGEFILLGIGLYVLGLFVQYWTAQSYKDGLTVKEVTMAVLWPLDTVRTIREGVHRQQGIGAFTGTNLPSSQDTSHTLIEEKPALYGGIIATVFVGFPVMISAIASVLDITGELIWLAMAVYLIGFVVNFWVSMSYKNGLTVGEIILNALWPIDIIKKIRAGVTQPKQQMATV